MRNNSLQPIAKGLSLIVVGAFTLAWVAYWNGFPLISGDSGGYIISAFTKTVEARRPSIYPLFIHILMVGNSLWPVIASQCFVVSFYLLILVLTVLDRYQSISFLVVTMMLAATTPLPWFSVRLMPDIFAGITGIIVYLLVFARKEWPVPIRILLILGLALCIGCHIANILITICGLSMALIGWRLLGGSLRSVVCRAATVLIITAVAALSICTLNLQSNGIFGLTSESDLWIMARLVRYGVVQRLLDDRCADFHYALCQYKDRLSMEPDHFMFSPDSPLRDIGGAENSHAVLRPIIEEANTHYIGMQFAAALRASIEQFGMVHLNMGLGKHDPSGMTGPPAVIKLYLPSHIGEYSSGRQRSGRLRIFFFNKIVVPTFWVSILGVICGLVLSCVRRDCDLGGFLLFFLIWITANAVVMGALNAPFDRYQARVAWLMPAVFAIAAGRMLDLVRPVGAVSVDLKPLQCKNWSVSRKHRIAERSE